MGSLTGGLTCTDGQSLRGLDGTPEWIRTTDLLLRRLETCRVFSYTCMQFLDATWTEPDIVHLTAGVFMGTTFPFPFFKFAPLTIFSARRSNTSETCWLGTCV